MNDHQLARRPQRDRTPNHRSVESDQSQGGPVGRIHRRDSLPEVVQLNGNLDQEQTKQRGKLIVVASSPEQSGPVQRAQGELALLPDPESLVDVFLVETDPVEHLPDFVNHLRLIDSQRGFVGQTAHEMVSRAGRIEIRATVKPATSTSI